MLLVVDKLGSLGYSPVSDKSLKPKAREVLDGWKYRVERTLVQVKISQLPRYTI